MVPCEVLNSRQRKLPTGFVRRTPRYFISFMNLTDYYYSVGLMSCNPRFVSFPYYIRNSRFNHTAITGSGIIT